MYMEHEYHDAMTSLKAVRSYVDNGGKNMEVVRNLAYHSTEPMNDNFLPKRDFTTNLFIACIVVGANSLIIDFILDSSVDEMTKMGLSFGTIFLSAICSIFYFTRRM